MNTCMHVCGGGGGGGGWVLVHVCLFICTKESLSLYLNTYKAIHGGENGSVY